jgi:hypothetical protein
MEQRPTIARRELRTPRAAAIAGIVFALLLMFALVLVRLSVPDNPQDAGAWLSDPTRRRTFAVGLNLVPFAGIAFLWFIGVVRDRIGAYEDRFFASVFLGSGLLFVGMLFVSAAVAAGLLVETANQASTPPSDVWGLGRSITNITLNIYAMRMAAVFTISTATIGLRTGVIRRWLGFLGYAVALVLLVSVGISPWVELAFPTWILLLSVDILVAGFRRVETERS